MVSKDSEVEQCKKQPLQQPQAFFSSSSHQSAQCGSMVCTQEQEWQGRWPILPPHPKEFPAQPRSCTALQGRGDLQTEGEISLATPHARPLTALAHPQLPSHRAIQGQHPMPNPTLAALQGLPFPRHEAVLGQSSPFLARPTSVVVDTAIGICLTHKKPCPISCVPPCLGISTSLGGLGDPVLVEAVC